jgi:ribonuclease HI
MLSSNEFWIFTDGACSGNPGPGGWAFLLGSSAKVCSMRGFEKETTNNRMELMAIIEALKFLKNEFKVSKNSRIRLFTDSSYVFQGITEWIWSWKKRGWTKADGAQVMNVLLWKELDEIVQSLPQIQWGLVPGHEGIAGNEWVDQESVKSSQELKAARFEWAFKDFPAQNIFEKLPRLRSTFGKTGRLQAQTSSSKTFYASFVKGEVQRHNTWAECEARVKGQAHARFKKLKSESEYQSWLQSLNQSLKVPGSSN